MSNKQNKAAKTLRKLEKKKELVIDWLVELKTKIPEDPTFDDILYVAYDACGYKYFAKRRTLAGYHACFGLVLTWSGLGQTYRNQKLRESKGKAPRKPTRLILQPKTKDCAKQFYSSYEWRKLRYKILQRDGAQCSLCGALPGNGIVMNVDHIKPLRKYWTIRLDPKNLQVLCNECNHGKGNWDETDWRKA